MNQENGLAEGAACLDRAEVEAAFVLHPQTLNDLDRSLAVRALHEQWETAGGSVEADSWTWGSVPPVPEAICWMARGELRPFSGWEPRHARQQEWGQSMGHAWRCPACREWLHQEMPPRFLMAWSYHRLLFCRQVQTLLERCEREHDEADVLLGSSAWLLTYGALQEHLAQCEFCSSWHAEAQHGYELRRTLTCATVRAYFVENGGLKLADDEWPPVEYREAVRHFFDCPACQEWALSLPCEEARETVREADRFNLNGFDYKRRLSATTAYLTPPFLHHAQHCPRCWQWLDEWEVELHHLFVEQEHGGFENYRRDLKAWKDAFSRDDREEATPTVDELKRERRESGARWLAKPKPEGQRDEDGSPQYDTPESAVAAALRFLEANPIAPRHKSHDLDSILFSPDPWFEAQQPLNLASIGRDDFYFEERIRKSHVPSPKELFEKSISADLQKMANLSAQESDEDQAP